MRHSVRKVETFTFRRMKLPCLMPGQVCEEKGTVIPTQHIYQIAD
jgi:hypothetical protein